ncbi:hypothetical protein C8R45DRAFT_383645 [Mycena sanguinolenta]|nr:hypothetical protein C8R45DRAFT_383645 [Mycena sanguinolenta]
MHDPPPELLDQILDAFVAPLGIPTEHVSDRKALLSCSLVSRHWSTQSQRLLFRRVVLRYPDSPLENVGLFGTRPMLPTYVHGGPDPFAYFFRTITADTDKSRWLRETVLAIVLRPHSAMKTSDTLALITKLPNLRELEVVGVACAFTEAELLRLRNLRPSIRSLRVDVEAPHSGPITPTAHWPAVINLIAAIPTLRMLDITGCNWFDLPGLPQHPPLGLGLISFKFASRFLIDVAPFLGFLIGDRTDNEHLEVFYHRETASPRGVRLDRVLSVHGPHLRSLVVPETPANPDILSSCTQLERFECESLPSRALVAAIPRTITTLVLKDQNRRTLTYKLRGPLDFDFYESNKRPCVDYLTEQLHTFPALRRISCDPSVLDHDRDALQAHCTELGIEMSFPSTINPEDDVEFSLRCRLLRI